MIVEQPQPGCVGCQIQCLAAMSGRVGPGGRVRLRLLYGLRMLRKSWRYMVNWLAELRGRRHKPGPPATPAGLRAMAVQVDQTSGVGTIIKTGDYVDVVVGLTDDSFPVFIVSDDPTAASIADTAPNRTSVKVLIQGLQVLGTLLPPPPVDAEGRPVTPTNEVTLNGRQQLVILAVTPQQSELIKFAQIDGSLSLVLRSPLDFVGPDGTAVVPPITTTTGIVLRTLVDQHGVLVPEIIGREFTAP